MEVFVQRQVRVGGLRKGLEGSDAGVESIGGSRQGNRSDLGGKGFLSRI